ncbi:class I SAM-dependent methyltransferase [Ideonella sp.]|uniref:class I SAM-dependent methyltransferase n=1 Tax=Ideonella sp. TaxID=1929293 RepID=UPI0035B27BAF
MNTDLLDRVNQAWYAKPGSVAGMAAQHGFTDEGERAAYGLLAQDMQQRPILDLGVGPGRTVGLLQALSADYVGIDYLPAMVEAARAQHPQADIRLGDARDLGAFASGSKALVVFSNHGIDSVSHEDRLLVLAEAWRVLVPGGIFWFSTLNAVGPAARYRPWLPLVAPADKQPGAWLHHTLDWARALARVPTHTTRYWRSRALLEAGTGWAVAPFFAGGWRLVTHYTTLPELLRELADAGFAADPVVVEDAHGRRVGMGDDLRPVFGFNVLARKPDHGRAGGQPFSA